MDNQIAAAAEWVRGHLAAGPMSIGDVIGAAKSKGIAIDVVCRAREVVGAIRVEGNKWALPATYSPPGTPRAASSSVVPTATPANDPTEKARLKAILCSEEGQARKALAEHIAYETDMTADQAIRVLRAAPLEGSAPGPTSSASATFRVDAAAIFAARAADVARVRQLDGGRVANAEREAATPSRMSASEVYARRANQTGGPARPAARNYLPGAALMAPGERGGR